MAPIERSSDDLNEGDTVGPIERSSDDPTGADLIAAERERQVAEEGWTAHHDDHEAGGGLPWAAICYAAPERIYRMRELATGPQFADPWPWHNSYDRRKDGANYPNKIPTEGPERLRMLVKAGALIAAEIDRLQRKADHG